MSGGGFGFQKRDATVDYDNIKSILMKEIERFFRPEFINRLDDIIVFRPLSKEDLVQIIEYEVGKVTNRLKSQGFNLELDQPAKDFLIEKGYNPDYGARPLRRAIGTYIEDPLSEMLLAGELHNKSVIKVSRVEGEDKLTFNPTAAPPATDGQAVKAAAGST